MLRQIILKETHLLDAAVLMQLTALGQVMKFA